MIVADTLQSAEAILDRDGRQLTLVDENQLLNDVAQPFDDINCYFIDEFATMCEIPSDNGEIVSIAPAEQTSKIPPPINNKYSLFIFSSDGI